MNSSLRALAFSLGSLLSMIMASSCGPADGGGFSREDDNATVIEEQPLVAPFLGTWVAEGPAPNINAQVENMPPDNSVAGAVQVVVPHPTNANILFAASVNGGIWRTTNAAAASPSWTALTDFAPSLSMGALARDLGDTTGNTLLGGFGGFSSFGVSSNVRPGVILSRNATAATPTFTVLSGQVVPISNRPILEGQNVSAVAIRANTLLVASTFNATFPGPGPGLFRSTNGGTTFTQVLGNDPNVFFSITDVQGDTTNLNRYYVGSNQGVFRSEDGGATWINVSNNNADLAQFVQFGRVKLAVGRDGRVYVACISSDLVFIAFSTDRGGHWTAMDLPRTPSLVGGPPDGTNPESDEEVVTFGPLVATGERPGIDEEPGGQGFLHFAITVDPGNSNLVYVGGDRQPLPSFIGANNFSGRLFRGNAAIAPTGAVPSPQWAHLTNSNAIPQIPTGGTASNSSPHADSRSLAFDAAGNLVHGNDGGIAKRTRPQNNTGDWFSMVGNLQVAELHDAAYDPVSGTMYGGTQDTGTPEKIAYGTRTWSDNSQGDGGDAAVDTLALPGLSIRYVSNQFLFGFKRQVFDGRGIQVPDPNTGEFDHFNFLITNGEDDQLFGGFVTPFATNRVQGNRVIISANFLYESFNRGDNITELRDAAGFGAFGGGHGIAYGHAGNPDMLYVAQFGQLSVRTTVGQPVVSRQFPQVGTSFFSAEDVVMGANPQTAYIAGNLNDFPLVTPTVFVTTNAGATFTNITGDLGPLNPQFLRAIEFIPASGTSPSKLVVSGDGGVFISPATAGTWSRIATNLPRGLVFDSDYSSLDDLLVVGFLGRGSYSICNVSKLNASAPVPDTTRPRFTFVPPPVTLSDCHQTPVLGQAVAVDNCRQPVTVTNNAPATFPAGVTIVTWTARDAAGNTATATQQVIVFLGDDSTCCPAGTNVIRGTAGNDQITGTAGADCILGLGGNDTIDARGGNDLVSGGAGNDIIQGGDGNDVIACGLGDDTVDSGNGNDAISGGAGRDTIAAGLGSDFVDGGDEFDNCSVPTDGTDTVLSCNP